MGGKRIFDCAAAAIAAVLLSPVFLVLVPMVALSMGRPIFFTQPRPGLHGRPFRLIKFRTMRDARDADGRPLPDAERLTAAGRLLRATSLDELPELWNVLRGEMSLVGPRPIRPRFFGELCVDIPEYWQRLVVRPGVTGLAQLRLTREMTWSEKLAHDLEFIADRSLRLYLSVISTTVWLIVVRPANRRSGLNRLP
jgi:lipopolysaccharide/colanic/teichoic acid biosynthesis glycosyltransferase